MSHDDETSVTVQDLTGPPTNFRRNVKEFGAAKMFDGSADSCWASDQGTPQWVHLQFSRPVCVREVLIMFQGGFAGKEVDALVSGEAGEPPRVVATFYPIDDNSMQSFPVDITETHDLRLLFKSSTDFYGRITVYQLAVMGASLGDRSTGP